MARLNKFLLEISNSYRVENREHRSVPITKDTFLKLKEKHCKQAIDSEIYRGIKHATKDDYLFIDPSRYTRISEYTENWYMLLMELLPQWKKFPKLSKSIICTTHIGEADNWGPIYKVYPYDNAVLAVAPEKHFWGSFPYTMVEINEIIIKILELFNMDLFANETDPNVLKKALNKIDSLDKSKIDMEYFSDVYFGYDMKKVFVNMKNGMPALKAFGELLPSNRFILKKIGDKLPKNKQIWTESPCILEYVRDYEDNEEEE